jgi:hypothetical protein
LSSRKLLPKGETVLYYFLATSRVFLMQSDRALLNARQNPYF